MLLGNLFEHYDTALFSLLSPFFAPLFFPGQDPLTALILTYCIIPLGMIARPAGSLFFGYIGDTRGREQALFLALTGMALVTAFMGFMPVYAQAGFLAPVCLSLGRILQNFCAAGESMGGAIYLLENASESKKDLTSSIFNASTIGGIILASFAVSLLCALGLIESYWRMLYFLGCTTALFAIMLRFKMIMQRPPVNQVPASTLKFLLTTCWGWRKAILTIAVASGFSYASYTMALVMMNGFVPLVTAISKEEMMHLNTFLLGIDFILLPLFGFIASRFSRNKMMIAAAVLSILSGIPLLWLLKGASLFTVILVRLILVVIGVWFCAPFYSWAQQLVPSAQRYTVISFAYAIGTQLFGGPTAAVSLWLFQKTGWVVSVGWYWMLLGLAAGYLISRQKAYAEDESLVLESSPSPVMTG
jgi:MFS family permease